MTNWYQYNNNIEQLVRFVIYFIRLCPPPPAPPAIAIIIPSHYVVFVFVSNTFTILTLLFQPPTILLESPPWTRADLSYFSCGNSHQNYLNLVQTLTPLPKRGRKKLMVVYRKLRGNNKIMSTLSVLLPCSALQLLVLILLPRLIASIKSL